LRINLWPISRESATPSSKWFANGEQDPHENHYDCERAALLMGDLADDELANAVFLYGNITPNIQDVIDRKAFMPIAYLTAAKERIRWLSRKLNEALARKPLTDDEIESTYGEIQWRGRAAFFAGVRFAEDKHGIKDAGMMNMTLRAGSLYKDILVLYNADYTRAFVVQILDQKKQMAMYCNDVILSLGDKELVGTLTYECDSMQVPVWEIDVNNRIAEPMRIADQEIIRA
jgi:hypothetical protein